ncbi:hypothetical protein JCM3770_004295, partial [Rhodotorula araucariae]
ASATPTLLPPYIPSPAFSAAFQTTVLLSSAETTPLGSSSPASDYFGDAATAYATPSPATPRSAASAPAPHTFFGRIRSNSMHSSHPSMSRACNTPPPTFSGPSTPSSMSASSGGGYLSSSLHSSTSTAASSVFPSPTDAPPFIKAVTVPHHSGSGKHCLFACRVVPDLEVSSPPAEPREKAYSRRESLGKMRMAGMGEPHTVWRSWQECLDFSAALSAAFPDNRLEPPLSTATFPGTHHKVPRLHSKKLAHLFKSSSLKERQVELEAFCAQLFQMAPAVRHSYLVRDFFRIRPQDALSLGYAGVSSPHTAAPGESSCDVPASVPDWLVAGDPENDLVDATIRAPTHRSVRPALAIKTSSPDLRGLGRGWAGEDSRAPSPLTTMSVAPRSSDFLRPHLSGSTSTLAQSHPGDPAMLSTATSSRTITPIPSTSRSPTPSGGAGLAKTLKKKASGGLRHIRSLGDLRGSSKRAETPDEPVPALSPATIAAAVSSFAMDRAATQPLPSSTTVALTSPLRPTYNQRQPSAPVLSPLGRLPPMPISAHAQSRHRRNRSSQSSTSSFEELWGTAFPTAFRQTPSGRLECVREPQSGMRRPSLSTSAIRPTGAPQQSPARPPMFRHKQMPSSASISSLDSARSGGSSGSSRSLAMSLSRSSAGSETCATPPTPNAEWSANGDKGGERIVAGKFYVENGVLHENNTVPPPPFFPVPPPPMQFAYSHDGLPHTPRSSGSSSRATDGRKPSADQQYPPTPRSRTGSTASSRRVPLHGQGSLDPILASPVPSSAASSPRTTGGSRTSWTFKLLHQDENVILRVSKPVDGAPTVALGRLRADIRAKFHACGVVLPGADEQGEWGLAWTTRESGVATGTKLIIAQEDLDACLRAHDESAIAAGKIVLKVIC